jgi:predicted nucleic acid-binding protein
VIVVSDTGPLISLAVINQLDLLEKIFEKVIIPEAVWDELLDQIEAFNIPQVSRFQANVIPLKQKDIFIDGIDLGETEAILLYEEAHADQLLIDDKFAVQKPSPAIFPVLGRWQFLSKQKSRNIYPA